MDFTLDYIVLDDNRQVLVDANGAKLCQVHDSEGESSMMYLSDNQIRQLTRNIGEAELTDSENEDAPMEEAIDQPSTSRRIVWPIGISQFLLDQYIQLHTDVGPMKKLRNKNEMWKTIVETLKEKFAFLCNADQCESHFKSIKRSYANSEKKRNTSGSDYIDSPYAEGMAKLKSVDDSLKPELLVGIGQQKRLKPQKRRESSEKKNLQKKDNDGIPESKRTKVIQAMYDIHEKTQKKIDERFDKMYNLVEEMYAQNARRENNSTHEISDSDSD